MEDNEFKKDEWILVCEIENENDEFSGIMNAYTREIENRAENIIVRHYHGSVTIVGYWSRPINGAIPSTLPNHQQQEEQQN